MKFDDKNRGSFWKNDRKETDKHPDWTGSLNVDGLEYWVSGWTKRKDANPKAPLLSFTVKLKEAKAPAKPVSAAQKDVEFDDEIPGF
jgi:hypothetical protein